MPRKPLLLCTLALVAASTSLLPVALHAHTPATTADAAAGRDHPGDTFLAGLAELSPGLAGLSFLFLLAGLIVLARAVSKGEAAVFGTAPGSTLPRTPRTPVPAASDLHDRIIRLERANEELENFVHIVAHDLKAPLRTIFDLADWLQEDNEGTLSEESAAYLKMLQHRANSMSALLSDLMDYARSVETEEAPRAVDLGALVADIAFLLDPVRQFEIDVFPTDCKAIVPKTPLRHILLNLISNAMQHHDRSYGRISITLEQDGERYIVCVADDGPGIAPEDQTRIFAPFERGGTQAAHSVNRGLGLVIVKKILARYGGTIDVRSDPEHLRGTVFRFEFPVFSLT